MKDSPQPRTGRFRLQSRLVIPRKTLRDSRAEQHAPQDSSVHFRGGAAPELICSPVRDGSMWLCRNDRATASIRVTRFTEDGRIDKELVPELNGRPQRHDAPAGWPRLAGFAVTRDGFALAHATTGTSEGTTPMRLTVQTFDTEGQALQSFDSALESGHNDTWLVDRGSPMWQSSGRLAYGRGVLCMHVGHAAGWPDGTLAQGGFARTVALGPRRPLPTNELAPNVACKPWFCSRSLDQRCAFDAHRNVFVAVALSDGFPRGIVLTTLGGASTSDQIVQGLPGAAGAAETGAELGGVLALREFYAVSFTGPVAAQPESRDVFVAFSPANLRGTPLVVRVTAYPPGTYAVAPKLASIGSQLLVAWRRVVPESGQIDYMTAVVSPQAQIKSAQTIMPNMFFDRTDDFVTAADGTVNWFAARSDGVHWLRLWSRRAL